MVAMASPGGLKQHPSGQHGDGYLLGALRLNVRRAQQTLSGDATVPAAIMAGIAGKEPCRKARLSMRVHHWSSVSPQVPVAAVCVAPATLAVPSAADDKSPIRPPWMTAGPDAWWCDISSPGERESHAGDASAPNPRVGPCGAAYTGDRPRHPAQRCAGSTP